MHYILLLSLFITINASGQFRSLFFDAPADSRLLRKNKIKRITEIHLYKLNVNTDTTGIFDINNNGKVVRYDYYYLQGNKKKLMTKRITQDSNLHTTSLTVGELLTEKDSLAIFNQETQYFTKENIPYRTLIIRNEGNKIIDDFTIDTIIRTTTYRSILTMGSNDTVRLITYDTNYDKEIYIHREKVNGVWNHEEKSETDFENGKFVYYRRTVNGKLVNAYGPYSTQKTKDDDRDYHPLPHADKSRFDSSFVHLKEHEIPFSNKKNELMLQVEYHVPYNKGPVSVKLFYPSGLLFSVNNTHEKYQTFYVYE